MREQVFFYPFVADPPDTDDVMDVVFSAFQTERSSSPQCAGCLCEEQGELLCSNRCLANDNPDVLAGAFNRHPQSIGGLEVMRQLFPHAVETLFFDDDICPDLAIQAFRSGVWFWPEEEQAALRKLFCRVAINWFTGGEPLPLELPIETRRYPSGQVYEWREPAMSARIIEALILLRVRPTDVMDWLVETGGERAVDWMTKAVASWGVGDETSFYYLPDCPEEEHRMVDVKAALARIANHALFSVLTPDRLFSWWQQYLQCSPRLAARVEEVEAAFASYDRRISLNRRAADLDLIEGFLSSGARARSA